MMTYRRFEKYGVVLIPVKIQPKILAQTCKPYVDLRTNLRIGLHPDPERKFADSEKKFVRLETK